jgi:ribonuclease HI
MTRMDKPEITIYTDGGSDPNPGPGGWAALLLTRRADGSFDEREISGNIPDTTNNRMELTAAAEALRALESPYRVTLYTDSQYLRQGITEWIPKWANNQWRTSGKTPVKNQDLWQALHAETQRHTITWQWVKGHAGNEYNERVDRLATAARQAITGVLPGDDDFTPEIEITMRVRVVVSRRRGAWAIRIAPTTGDEPPRIVAAPEENGIPQSDQRLELLATLHALRQIPPGTATRIYCPSDYLYSGMTRWILGWQKNGWITQEGKPVRHRDLWEALIAEAQKHTVQWAHEPDPPPDYVQQLKRKAIETAGGGFWK